MAINIPKIFFTTDAVLKTAILRPKKIVFVPGNPTDPTFLGPTLKMFGTSGNFSLIFKVF